MASRYGAEVRRIERPWGEVFTLAEIEAAIKLHKPQILWLCYGDACSFTIFIFALRFVVFVPSRYFQRTQPEYERVS